ncbi:GTPase family protein [Granulosicoccus antarcticus]|uniref:tRNA modification GTPase MnmE n=1 Tax=Granulosicoccus antarcticus IMCC3135 TaxID=1192854 RepID=A0A2Z2NUQ4_9GAMM|nr:GTPase domain-containing protein [Granulosicoccus antarcticus]ASJ71397.1 tRNA modification GTPase MnmE [Granulosicoccus antarcticus IMCC3135]
MNLRSLFRGSTHSAAWYIALVVLLPVFSLSLLGVAWLWQNDRLLQVLAIWLGATLIGYTAFILWSRHREANHSTDLPKQTKTDEAVEQLPDSLDERQDWTEQDRAVWRQVSLIIESRLAEELAWQSLPDESLQLLSAVSSHYHPDIKRSPGGAERSNRLEYRFTLPEALLVLSVASERYRHVILQHIPFAEKVTVASLVTLYSKQQNIKTGYMWFNTARRTLRLANPVAAAIGELKDQFTNRVFDHLSVNVQKDLKRLLLQEVVQVGIDLYSGKLKTSANELQEFRSSAYQQDIQQPAPASEPLRIVIAGQTSAGKSSLVNALADTLEAEVDILPTTDRTVTHRLQLDGAAPMHIIDTVGLNHTIDEPASLMQLAMQADMLLLVVRANQPARAPDQQVWQALQQGFAALPRRRMPPIMLVMTHVDQLTPKALWEPPYALDSDDRKASNIRDALLSATSQIGLPAETPAIPVCLSVDKGRYNVDAVAAQLMMLQDNATLTQLNRRRVERGEQSFSWRERWSQVKRLGQVLGRAAVSSSADKPD